MTQHNSELRMSFFDHLDELRVRVIRCLWVFTAGFLVLYFFSEQILGILRGPLFLVLPPTQQKLYFTSLFENFLTHLKIAGYSALFVFSPYYFYQLWCFIAPGLYSKERRLALPFICAATTFFLGGACFAYFIVFPVGFKFFVTYGGPTDIPLLTIDSYYTTCLKLLLLFGLAFEIPVIIVFLGYIGLVDSALLRKHRRVAIIGITVIAALFAPPDAVSMLMLGGPLVLLYECSIWVVQWLEPRRRETRQVEDPLEGRSRP
ncbi:MAG: twin-arginine translocase subunit TatC [Candidatus Poribacteria bacterium]